MKDQLIEFETAKLVKKKGFDCSTYPTQSLLQKWLREVHGFHIVVIPTITRDWTFKTITVTSKRDDDVILGLKSVSEVPPYKNVTGEDFCTYEQALEAGLKEGLKQIP